MKKAFTLIEMLISVLLLGFVMMALYNSSDMLKKSNAHLYKYLQGSSKNTQTSQLLYLDILGSDGNISIQKEDSFYRLIINSTTSSIYGRQNPKVAWLVYKENNTLLRVEGDEFNLPLGIDDRVDIDKAGEKMELFSLYASRGNDKILVILKEATSDAKSFLVQNLNIIQFTSSMQDTNQTPSQIPSQNTPQVPTNGEVNFITNEPNGQTDQNQQTEQTTPQEGSETVTPQDGSSNFIKNEENLTPNQQEMSF
ncbi:MAG: prepilin-type N-terminal cleavage/methylation domain-containing protein [Sulfurovum sp.]|nr:MAG: prepilin-type N-terminal cleavage/methylation domain-containing protein [Sulfurovum sp.]